MSEACDATPSAPSPAKKPRRLRRVLKVTWKVFSGFSGIVGALVLLVAAYCVYINWRGEAQMRAALQALEKHGIDAQMQTSWFRDPPDADERDDGGARYYYAAFELLAGPWSEQENLPYLGIADPPGICDPLAPELAAVIAAYVQRKDDFFQAFATARKYPEPVFRPRLFGEGHRGADVVSKMLEVVHHQLLVSLLAQSRGDADGACEACQATLDVSRALAGEEKCFVQLRVFLLILASEQIEQALSRVRPSPERLQALREKFLASAESVSVKRACAAELALSGGILRFPDYWWARADLSLQESLALEAEFIPMEKDARGQQILVPAENVSKEARRSRARKARLAASSMRLWLMVCPGSFKITFSAGIEQGLKEYEALDAPDHVLAERAVAAGGLSGDASSGSKSLRLAQRFLRSKAMCRVAASALAVEIHRLKNGRWPARLREVEGGELLDPFTGKPLKYRRTDDGVLIYSVGENLIDEGGNTWHPPPEEDPPRMDDHAVQLFDPEKRNVKRSERPWTR